MPSKRKKGESESDFISRCMSEIKSEFPENAQRYAVCKSYSDKFSSENKEELFVLQPRKNENRGMYLKRCSSNSKIKSQFVNLKERSSFCLSSFNEYYKYWNKIEMGKIPENSALGECIAIQKSKGYTYQEAYAHCSSRLGNKPLGPGESIVLSEDNLLIEPVEFSKVVSIDFDDTLSTTRGMEMAKKLIDDGVDLHIVTRRNKNESEEVYKIAEELGIPQGKVHFTEGKLKWETIKELGVEEHIDNSSDEIKAIEVNLPDVKAVKFSEAFTKCVENHVLAGFPKDKSAEFCKSRMEK